MCSLGVLWKTFFGSGGAGGSFSIVHVLFLVVARVDGPEWQARTHGFRQPWGTMENVQVGLGARFPVVSVLFLVVARVDGPERQARVYTVL